LPSSTVTAPGLPLVLTTAIAAASVSNAPSVRTALSLKFTLDGIRLWTVVLLSPTCLSRNLPFNSVLIRPVSAGLPLQRWSWKSEDSDGAAFSVPAPCSWFTAASAPRSASASAPAEPVPAPSRCVAPRCCITWVSSWANSASPSTVPGL
jgi:hypothetical protein